MISKCTHTHAEHEAIKHSAEWSRLPFVGVQEFPGMAPLEMRNASCGSTLCKPIENKEAA